MYYYVFLFSHVFLEVPIENVYSPLIYFSVPCSLVCIRIWFQTTVNLHITRHFNDNTIMALLDLNPDSTRGSVIHYVIIVYVIIILHWCHVSFQTYSNCNTWLDNSINSVFQARHSHYDGQAHSTHDVLASKCYKGWFERSSYAIKPWSQYYVSSWVWQPLPPAALSHGNLSLEHVTSLHQFVPPHLWLQLSFMNSHHQYY